ncbi:MAG: bifunctional adenosylcobinamide kinase/adenosylcobinamide-phosphate guanylyltransferase [Rikenellaceae bacterium]|nr:bifunctional adenosylcobinamide kinase/adenosylcobinamide-phosphate guanylyltransferase [Rikenellaceae bacterium]
MSRIILITGGQRSGKSSFAQKFALSHDTSPVYIATSRIWDDEFKARVERHRKERGSMWINIEEEKFLSSHKVEGRVVVIDCVTLWATNFFYDNDSDIEKSLYEIKNEFTLLASQNATFLFVTNEIGLGGVSENTIQRKFTDLLGWLNQFLAEKADEIYLMISGIPLKIK